MGTPALTEQVLLPWKLPLRIRPAENIGHAVWTTGAYELVVSETFWRLLDPGETALDVGANIGYHTSILALRAGPAGRVWAFEPHPEIFGDLSGNVVGWSADRRVAPVELRQLALSSQPGEAQLHVGGEFEQNRGTASLAHGDGAGGRCITVPLARLDDVLPLATKAGVMKVDVEGHELGVLEGAPSLFGEQRVRDLVFEEFGTLPTPVSQWLTSHGYHLFKLLKRWNGVKLEEPGGPTPFSPWEAPNYLATCAPERARARLAPSGWQCLS